MAIDVGLAVSPSAATGSQATGTQNAETYFNFGAGYLNAPTENDVNPTQTLTPTATASATGVGSSGIGSSLTTYLPWAIAGLAVIVLAYYIGKKDVKKFKNFKTMTPVELIELLPEHEIHNSGATASVENLCHVLPPNHYEHLVSAGRVKSTMVVYDGKPVYRLIWEKILDGAYLSILLAQELGQRISDSRWLGAAIDMLAKQEKVIRVIFSTARRSLALQSMTWGAVPFQVWLKKDYQH